MYGTLRMPSDYRFRNCLLFNVQLLFICVVLEWIFSALDLFTKTLYYPLSECVSRSEFSSLPLAYRRSVLLGRLE